MAATEGSRRMYQWVVAALAAALCLAGRAEPASAQVAVGAGLESAYALLTAYDQDSGAGLMAPLEEAGVQVNWSRGAVGGGQPTSFLARGGARVNGGTIFVDPALASSSDAVVATLLTHEARHAADLIGSGRPLDPSACMDGEVRAHQEEARAWAYFAGPTGKADPVAGWETDLNALLATSQIGPEAVRDWIVTRGLSRC